MIYLLIGQVDSGHIPYSSLYLITLTILDELYKL